MTKTTDIETPEGDRMDIEVNGYSQLELISVAARAPDEITEGDPENIEVTPDVIEFMVDVTVEQTELTRDLLNELEVHELVRFISNAANIALGGDSHVERDDLHMDDMLEFNNDGSVNLKDWL